MKNQNLLFFGLILSLLLLFEQGTFAQWTPTNGPFSGEVHSIITNNGEIIVGTNYIYKSLDNGATWNMSNNGMSGSVNRINSLIKISTNIIAGTDAGVFYSADNGDNWTQSAGTASIGVFCMVVKGTNLFMSTVGSGVYKSTTNGTTWAAVNNGITNITWMRAIVAKGSDLYAATDGYGIYKSTNDGTTWSLVNTGLPGSFYSVSALAVVGNNIIAGTVGAGVYKSTNDGGSWSAINNGISTTDYIMGMGVNGTSIYASTILGNIYKTTDYSNWTAVSPGNVAATRFETFYQDGTKFYTGGWGFMSPEQSYGLFVTSDDGATWKHAGITDYPIAALEVSGNNILAGINDITSNSLRIPLFRTTETDSVWHFNIGGFVGNNITAIKSNGAVAYLFDYVGPGSSTVYRSTNNGNNWTSTGINAQYSHFSCFVIAGSMLYAGNDQEGSVSVSADNGQTWTGVNSGIPTSVYNIYSLVLKGTTLFAGTNNGVYKNTVGQNNWVAVSSGLTNMYIKSLCVSGSDIYAGTQGGGIFKSSNDGGVWTEINSGIPLFTNVTSFASSGTNVFAGTDNGVFVSSNGGTSWANVNTGLIDTNITAMTVSTNYLWAGTFTHGVWRRELSQFTSSVPPTPVSIQGSSTICPGSINTYSVAIVAGATSYTWNLPSGWTGTSTTNSITTNAGSSGIISVTANNAYSSSSPQTLNVSVTTVNISVTPSGLTLTSNANGASFMWIDCSNNQPVIGQTSQSFTATVSGNYAVIVNQSGCIDTSACYLADNNCNVAISGVDLPHSGLSVLLSADSLTNVSLGNPDIAQNWDYSDLTYQYQKVADYKSTSTTAYASTFPYSNIYTYGPGNLYGSLYGSAPVGSNNNGYVFWKSDNTGFWVTGFRPDEGLFGGVNAQETPQELLIASPASYGNVFNNTARWELPLNNISSDADTFYVRNVVKTITADACGSITTPYTTYPNVLREHEYVISIDSIYIKTGSITFASIEYKRDTTNNYMYLSNGIGYPVCIVHADKNNNIEDVEYYNGLFSEVTSKALTENEMNVFPNPSEGKFTLQLSEAMLTSGETITIYNSVGNIVWEKPITENTLEIDLSNMSKGIYYVHIFDGRKNLSKKIVLQ